MASTPKLASCSTTPDGYLSIPIGGEVHFFIVKAHRGFPWRELETFTLTELLAAGASAVFFDLNVQRVDIFDQTFTLTAGINLVGNVVRFYWNAGSSDQIFSLEYDVVTRQVVTPAVALPFSGRDPFVFDARSGVKPNRIYIMYVTKAGGHFFRISTDLGSTWGAEFEIDPPSASVREAEGAIEDPTADSDLAAVIQRRDP